MVKVHQFLSRFNFKIKYKANTTPQIQAANALSRAIILKGMEGIESIILNSEFSPSAEIDTITLVTRGKIIKRCQGVFNLRDLSPVTALISPMISILMPISSVFASETILIRTPR